MTDVYAIASRPGPVEAAALEELAPTFRVRRRAAAGRALRYLEGGSGPPVCLLHGRGHAATAWLPLMEALAREHRVVALDLPGFGHSSSGPFRGTTADDAVRFFVEPVEVLLGDLGLAHAALVGHSLGGLVALELGLRRALAPERIALIASMGLAPTMTTASRAFFRLGPERLARRLGPAMFSRISPLPDTPMARRIAALEHELCAVPGGRPEASRAFDALYPIFGPCFSRRDRLGELTMPTLVYAGERDVVFPLPGFLSASAAIPGARLVVAPLGHAPHLEDPRAVLSELTPFLDPGRPA